MTQTTDDIKARMAERISHIDHALANLMDEKARVFAQIKELREERTVLDRMVRATQPRKKQ